MSHFDESSEVQKYWNEEGGKKWVDSIDVRQRFKRGFTQSDENKWLIEFNFSGETIISEKYTSKKDAEDFVSGL